MRRDAYRFLRSDWRRFVQLGSELSVQYSEMECKFRPDQPRIPSGVPEGGRWTIEDGSATALLIPAAYKGGHHLVPRGVYNKLPLRSDTKKVFDERTTGSLQDRSSNRYDTEHRAYNDAVGAELQKFMDQKGVAPEELTPEQAKEFVDQVISSRNPAIRNLNIRIYMREIMRGLWRRSRGGE